MSDIVLSAGVRQNLLALQNTAQLMTVTQNRLATGKKVNTAQDNPTNFFTSQSLQSRAGDLNSLLDSIGQAQQTITAANQGITSLSSLIQSAISTAKQAQQSTAAGFTYDLTAATGTATINADTTRTTSSSTLTSVAGGLTAHRSAMSSSTLRALPASPTAIPSPSSTAPVQPRPMHSRERVPALANSTTLPALPRCCRLISAPVLSPTVPGRSPSAAATTPHPSLSAAISLPGQSFPSPIMPPSTAASSP